MPKALEVALIDVGGTLWPNSWPFRASDGDGRRQRVTRVMAGHDARAVESLIDDLLRSSRPSDEARTVSTEARTVVGADELITGCLERQGMRPDATTIARIRRAMAIPIHDRFQPLPGAAELLATIHELGLRNVIASNTYWRDAGSYWEDFRQLGMAEHIDEIVTSVDAGHLKPHPAVFEMAMRRAGVPAAHCVVIGNREENDVEPALALGMHSILVHPDDPAPTSSRADAVAPDLFECARLLTEMVAG